MGTTQLHIRHAASGEYPGHYHMTDAAQIDFHYRGVRGFYGKDNLAIYVYDENDPKKTPHFHIIDKATNGKDLDIEVRIKDLSIACITDKSKHINNDTRKGLTWEGYDDLRKELIEFLKSKYVDKMTGSNFNTYYIYLVWTWNRFNPKNKVERSDLMSTIE